MQHLLLKATQEQEPSRMQAQRNENWLLQAGGYLAIPMML